MISKFDIINMDDNELTFDELTSLCETLDPFSRICLILGVSIL